MTRFKKGDKVVTLFNQLHLGGDLLPEIKASGLGGALDGTLRQYGAFNENGLVHMPETLDFKQASTLCCAGLTAWNGLYGLLSRALKPGDTVLTQGTGGVSIFTLQVRTAIISILFGFYYTIFIKVQFAKAAGARVIATTSSSEKGEILKSLGADHVINYKEDPNWGETAKSLTPGGLGVEHIIEVGGPVTMAQSLKAIRLEGVITIIGFLAGNAKEQPSFLECLNTGATVRGALVGSRLQFEDMNRAIDAMGIKPVVDKKEFELEDLKEAYQYMVSMGG